MTNEKLIIERFKIMNIKSNINNLHIDRNFIYELMENHSFDNKSIIFDKEVKIKDYADNSYTTFVNEYCIGHIIPDTVIFDGTTVYGDILINKEKEE